MRPHSISDDTQGIDTLKDIKAALHYFDQVASKDGGQERQIQIEKARNALSKTLARIENELQSMFDVCVLCVVLNADYSH